MNAKDLEKYSSAITLSDMEVFVFPELMYSLVLANIMSPLLWKWRQVDCFAKLDGKTSYRRLMRMRQYIMDEFDFNLDLETWGLTKQATEVERFRHVIRPEQIAASNALFGYTGDQYYFDVDIRKHFGLDKYDGDIIPYWKTETVEAMDAFRFKPGYGKAAGECVSLATLYAAAAFIVCGVPLEDIYLILTPLHSQNFIDMQDGILTNNRRLVTKTMWFNGTEISYKAQRALRNEQVTIVAHPSGYIHCFYDDATIDPKAYDHFTHRLGEYLSTDPTITSFASFLRCQTQYQKCFQICRDCHGQPQFLKAETLFSYEHGSPYKIGDATHDKLLAEVHDEDFVRYEIPGRVRCDRLDAFLTEQKPNLRESSGREAMSRFLEPHVPDAGKMVELLADFLHIQPRLPGRQKSFKTVEPIRLSVDQSREEIVAQLQSMRQTHPTVDLAFYALRDMETCDWRPFVKAAVERNPVSLERAGDKPVEEVRAWLDGLESASIYDGNRLAQPDEVANFGRGDGLEKAFLLANVLRRRDPDRPLQLIADRDKVVVRGKQEFAFQSTKTLSAQVDVSEDGSIQTK
ncbi:hypothetical protein [Anaerobaca lacustris]|uniref:Uncharacterized protein n=1 Tax=Anaerobaca lacustris TaxID=3044600 RepID=A0AAW6TYN2_9BACT|nr:hypothetical protein [Sedimentisphaerales bacterium M17dextr]